MSFMEQALSHMIERDNLLVRIESIIDWEPISKLLDKKLGKRSGVLIAGTVPYEYIRMFKALLIQQWHTLSDPKMEEALRTRVDFMWFTGFGLASKEFVVPDETTICRFRNKLSKAKILDKLLKQVNSQLEDNRLKIKSSHGAVLDATLIEAAVNSNAKPRVIVEDRDEDIKVLYTDKGYTSTDNSLWLQANKIGDGIMDKAYRNRPLTYKQKQRNKRISKSRYIVERTNATVKNIFKFSKSKYIGLDKVKNQALLVAVAHNLLKAANKIKVEIGFYRKVVSEKSIGGLFA